jgi:YD repeat-containing protein
VATLSYDPSGRLWQVAGTSGVTRFTYDGDRLIEELDGSGAWLRLYAHGPSADEPLVWYEMTGGLDLHSVWDLVNSSAPYPQAVAVLLQHLARPYSDGLREGIARALAVPEANRIWADLVTHWRASPVGTRAKNGLAVAVAGAASRRELGKLIDLAHDRSLGSSRIFLLRPLMRSRSQMALESTRRIGR